MPFLDSLDIANRALQHIGQPQILATTELTKANTECAFAYDKLRQAELRRNVWRFAIRKAILRAVDVNTVILSPALWNSATTYAPGAIVSDSNGQLWISTTPENKNNQPGLNTEIWDSYFGPLTADLYDSTIAYNAGEIVYILGSTAGTYQLFLSLAGSNSDAPNTAQAWSATTTYTSDQIVSYGGSQWRSLIPLNLNITPASGPAQWVAGTTYSAAQTVTGSDNYIYSSIGNSNIGNDPTATTGFWTNTGVVNGWVQQGTSVPTTDTQWLALSATAKSLNIVYPLGAGPSSQLQTDNIFRLPAGYVRMAPEDPKAGSTRFLGAPSGLAYSDRNLESNYIVTRSPGPIMVRFVADITVVSKMDSLFCEGLSARVGFEVCESLTQSTAKKATCMQEYQKFMSEARIVNGIETGAIEPAEDDYVQCRL